MGESDESVFWSEKEEDGYEGIFTSENFESNNIDDEESGAKRIRLSPEFNDQQEGEGGSSGESSPLGLTLSKTPSFLSLVQRTVCKRKGKGLSTQVNDQQSSHHDKPINIRTKMDDLGSQSMSEKLKASNFPATCLKIGAWQRATRHEGDLTAKLYYAKRKLVWEILDGALKSKIEIQWSDIIGIRATMPDGQEGTLEIELNQAPLYYREINPQPRKHTLWQQSSDFTGGQAPIWRRHYVRFPAGTLDKHYEKLLQCDQRLFALSQEPFPSLESPYFDPNMFGLSGLSLSFNRYRSAYLPGMQYPYNTYPPRLSPNSTFSVMDLSYGNMGGSSNQFANHARAHWNQGANIFSGNFNQQGPSHIINSGNNNQVFHNHQGYQSNVGLLDEIEQHLLGESQVLSSDDQTLRAQVESMCSLLEPITDGNPSYDPNNQSGRNYYQENDTSNDQVMQNGMNVYPVSDGFYQEPVNWLPPQDQSNDTVFMDQTVSPFFFPGNNPTNGDVYF